MNEAKNIYTAEQTENIFKRAIKLEPAPQPNFKKSVFARLIDFFSGPDLDLATFERLEGIARETERDHRHHYMGVRL